MTTHWSQKREIIHLYDSTAEFYETRYAEEQEAKYKVALENTTPSGKVLDVGCGTGLFFRHIVRETEAIIGIDSSKNILIVAQNYVRGRESIHLVQADADHIPFLQDFFDAVFSFTMLQNMPKPVETLKEFRRVAKPDSQIIVTGLKKVISMENLKEMIERAGLRQVSIINETILRCYVALSLKCST